MFFEQLERELVVALRERAVAHHVGKHDRGELALFRRATHINSLWFLFAEFLEARIVPQGIEHGIEPEQRRSQRHVFT